MIFTFPLLFSILMMYTCTTRTDCRRMEMKVII